MKGRAGRKGKDTHGESFLCYNKADEEFVTKMIKDEMPLIVSSLGREIKGIERGLLEAVVANLATSQTALKDYASKTLFYHQAEYIPFPTCRSQKSTDAQGLGVGERNVEERGCLFT
jgi:replicative superfamily II helicase